MGALLGAFPDVDLSDVTVELGQGDAAVFHTDGVIEAHGADGLFGDERLAEVVANGPGKSADELGRALEEAVLSYSGGRISNDLAIVVIRPDLGRLVVDLALTLSADAARLGRHSLEPLSGDLPVSTLGDVELIVRELVTNAVRHGDRDVGATSSGRLRVWLRPGRLRVEVTSPGWFDHVPPPGSLLAEGGRGLQIVRAVATDVGLEHDQAETTVWPRSPGPLHPTRYA